MATALKKEHIRLRKKMASFAEQYIAPRDDLVSMEGFPHDIWKKMGEEKLLGVGLPEEYGGLGGNCLSIGVAGETLTRRGHNMGIAVSWLLHNALSRFMIMGFGNQEQCDTYLSSLAAGEIILSIAVSEPGRGAQPKNLETSGYHNGNFHVLEGEKTYLTNGPIANLFLVVAITEVDGGRKRFTAFLVPKNTKGLSLTEPMKLDFFRPAPHGGIVLSHCSVPGSNILGREGYAYEEMVKPFREQEDILMLGPVVGCMERQLELLLKLIEKNHVESTDAMKKNLGELRSIVHTLRIVAYEAASMLDSPDEHPELASLLISSRSLTKQFQDLYESLIKRTAIEKDTHLYSITNDFAHSVNMGKNVTLIKQKKMGEVLLSRKEDDEFAL
ncbi:MAG: acyl-CoA dehydrogenase family protein [Thermodesulfobacteriota bacterium]|nr:acyl-CoA dehydrogenase family protein [Thermodesulfobacteriota bacterium]